MTTTTPRPDRTTGRAGATGAAGHATTEPGDPRLEADTAVEEEAVVVRTAMGDGRGHVVHRRLVDLAAVDAHPADETTHASQPPKDSYAQRNCGRENSERALLAASR